MPTEPSPSIARFESTQRIWPLRIALWCAPILLLLTLFGWALSSPAGSSPDDDFHAASIWCSHGERAGVCEEGDTSQLRAVPASIVQMSCFAFNSDIDGSCQHGVTEQASSDLVQVGRGNWSNHSYPPIFYWVMGVFASENVAISTLIMRFVNAIIATSLLAAAAIALPNRLRPVLALSTSLTLVPLGLSLIPSTNPSSWALISAAIVFPCMLALAEAKGRQRIALLAIAMTGVVLGIGARADAALFAAFAVALAWFLKGYKNRFVTILSGALIAVAVVAFLSTGQAGALGGLDTPDGARPASGSFSLLLHNIVELPSLWLGMFTNLGWLDTHIAAAAVFAMVFSVIGILYSSLNRISWRKGAALATVTMAISLIPLYMLHSSNAVIGTQVQPRYILPLLVILVAVAVSPIPETPRLSRVQTVLLGVLVSGAQALALYEHLTRYVAGQRIANLDNGEWWWGGSPIGPLATLAITSVSFALLLTILAVAYSRMATKDFTARVAA